LQDAVSESVALEIVDTLEIVEVHQKKRMLSSVGAGRGRYCRQSFEHRAAVRQIRQGNRAMPAT